MPGGYTTTSGALPQTLIFCIDDIGNSETTTYKFVMPAAGRLLFISVANGLALVSGDTPTYNIKLGSSDVVASAALPDNTTATIRDTALLVRNFVRGDVLSVIVAADADDLAQDICIGVVLRYDEQIALSPFAD